MLVRVVVLAVEVRVAELAHRVDDRQERLALLGQLVLDAGRRLRIAAPLDDPSPSSARSRSASVRGLMPQQDRSSCENRRGPSERSCTRSAVHLAPMISAEAATPQAVDSWTACIVRLIYRLYVPPSDVASRAPAR